jgi:hypothetical protein
MFGDFLDDLFDAEAPKRVLTANLGYYLTGGSQELVDSLTAPVSAFLCDW